MISIVHSYEVLQPVRVVQLPNGSTDIWLRQNIQGPLTEVSEEGFSNTFYTADEGYLRSSDIVTEEQVEINFDAFWDEAERYDPNSSRPKSHLDIMSERVTVLERDLMLREAQIQALTDRNDFTDDCLAEMAMLIYQ